MRIDVKILDPRMADQLPAYATPGSAGLDLRACLDEPLAPAPGAAAPIPTGLAIHTGGPCLCALLLVDEKGAAEMPRASKLQLARQLGAEIARRLHK